MTRNFPGAVCSAKSIPPISRRPAVRSALRIRLSMSGASSIRIFACFEKREHVVESFCRSFRRCRGAPRSLCREIGLAGYRTARQKSSTLSAIQSHRPNAGISMLRGAAVHRAPSGTCVWAAITPTSASSATTGGISGRLLNRNRHPAPAKELSCSRHHARY